ncbi:MAG: hypothetical protein IKK75_03100 [Clostridia bacterium]|nr:hypothetical protein [Clostridia bacterium]
MFYNIGGKIKAAAKAFCWIMIALSVVIGVLLIADRNALMGIIIMAAGSLIGWLSSFALYGFGEMVENSCIQTNLMIKWDKEKKE